MEDWKIEDERFGGRVKKEKRKNGERVGFSRSIGGERSGIVYAE